MLIQESDCCSLAIPWRAPDSLVASIPPLQGAGQLWQRAAHKLALGDEDELQALLGPVTLRQWSLASVIRFQCILKLNLSETSLLLEGCIASSPLVSAELRTTLVRLDA